MRRAYIHSILFIALIVAILNFKWPQEKTSNVVHLQFNDQESRLAAGCLIPITLVDEHIISKIPGISGKRAKLVVDKLQNIKNLDNLKLKVALEDIKGIGPKTATILLKYISPEKRFSLCNVLLSHD